MLKTEKFNYELSVEVLNRFLVRENTERTEVLAVIVDSEMLNNDYIQKRCYLTHLLC